MRIRVLACGVCRTDLHLAEGDLAPHRHLVTPGHEVVGIVDAVGPSCTRWREGQRIGIPWLAHTCGRCRFCTSGRENLCLDPRFTGWDVDGGYAEFALVDEAYAYLLPDRFDDVTAAPLLCAGIIGYRALRLADLPHHGRLGIYGFGGSAHLTAQVAMAQGARVHVMTRSAEARSLALQLGVASAGAADDPPPEPLDSAILFAPVGTLVPVALGRARSRRHAGHRRHLPQRRPVLALPRPPLRGADAAQRHREHTPRRRGIPGGSGPHRHPGGGDALPDGAGAHCPGRPGP